ncbi:hypothetical protein [Actinocatenispora rupis]|nr:hypothetical protein [Actinocatenispora rupis]
MYAAPPVLLRRRPEARGSVALPIVGLLLVVVGGLAMPFFGTGKFAESSAAVRDLGVWVVVLNELVVLVPSALLAFAGTLDSVVFRIFYTILGVLGVLVGAVVELAAGGLASYQGYGLPKASIGVSIIVGVVLLGWFVGFAFLRGLALRLVSGLLLLVPVAAHVVVVRLALSSVPDTMIAGFDLAALGYLLCAIGCFVGPRYVMRP